jgi:hypothetical protein
MPLQKRCKSRDGSYFTLKYDQQYDAFSPNQFSMNTDEVRTVGETEGEAPGE